MRIGRVGTAQSLALLSLVGKLNGISLDDRCLFESTGKMASINARITTGSARFFVIVLEEWKAMLFVAQANE